MLHTIVVLQSSLSRFDITTILRLVHRPEYYLSCNHRVTFCIAAAAAIASYYQTWAQCSYNNYSVMILVVACCLCSF